MTGISFIAITLALAGVFAVFWWLVEFTGGAAGQALSVCRSMETGFVSWRDSRGGTPPEPGGTHQASATTGSNGLFDAGLAVATERVRGLPKNRGS